ncbi:unnamed protein product [Amoebophrya sp. A120]|nr:unnamed protein product [Amoebophrya sp. A120]|eukprot:GSA120T00010936001.1
MTDTSGITSTQPLTGMTSLVSGSSEMTEVQDTTIQPIDARTLTMSMLKKRVNTVKRGKDESVKGWLRRISHLHLEELGITRFGESFAEQLPNVRVLYAYENALLRVDVLPLKLELLYLQHNDLYRFDWDRIFLSAAQKDAISAVINASRDREKAEEHAGSTTAAEEDPDAGTSTTEGAAGGETTASEAAAVVPPAKPGPTTSQKSNTEHQQPSKLVIEAAQLRTLNLSSNKLEELDFSQDRMFFTRADRLSWLSLSRNPFLTTLRLSGVAHSLEFLDVTHCRLLDLSALSCLRNLKSLHCEHNEIDNLPAVVEQLPANELTILTIHPNPCTVADKKYQEPLILSASRLEKIDSRDITTTERHFLLELWKRKHERAQQQAATAAAASEPAGSEMDVEQQEVVAGEDGASTTAAVVPAPPRALKPDQHLPAGQQQNGPALGMVVAGSGSKKTAYEDGKQGAAKINL